MCGSISAWPTAGFLLGMAIAVPNAMPSPRNEGHRDSSRYRSRSKTEDPWGTQYRIVCEPDSAIAISAGRDKAFDTGDDVTSDQPQ